MSITLKTPATDTGYASNDSGLGLLFSLCVSSARSIGLSNIKSYRKANATDRNNEVHEINNAFNKAREDFAQAILKHLLDNDGVVDAWPDPDTGIDIGFKLSEENDVDHRRHSYDTYYYKFDYFGGDYESNKYGLITGGDRSYRNPYKYKDTERIRSIRIHERNLLDDFKENNPLKFFWSLLIGLLIFFCFGGPIISTVYLFFLQRAADPEVVELAVEGFFDRFSWITQMLLDAPLFVQIIFLIIVAVPGIIILILKFLPEFICFLGGKSIVVLIIYGVMLFVCGFMSFGLIYAFLGERIPKARPIEGIICLFEWIRSKFSKERKKAHAENERLREEYTQLMEDFHQQWFRYVSEH